MSPVRSPGARLLYVGGVTDVRQCHLHGSGTVPGGIRSRRLCAWGQGRFAQCENERPDEDEVLEDSLRRFLERGIPVELISAKASEAFQLPSGNICFVPTSNLRCHRFPEDSTFGTSSRLGSFMFHLTNCNPFLRLWTDYCLLRLGVLVPNGMGMLDRGLAMCHDFETGIATSGSRGLMVSNGL